MAFVETLELQEQISNLHPSQARSRQVWRLTYSVADAGGTGGSIATGFQNVISVQVTVGGALSANSAFYTISGGTVTVTYDSGPTIATVTILVY